MATCCCLGSFFKRKQLIQKGYLTITDTVDPQILIWENLGVKSWTHCKAGLRTWALMVVLLVFSFWGQYYFANLEKDLTGLVRSDCSGESSYNID